MYRVLCVTRDAILEGACNYTELENQAFAALQEVGFKPDYISVCRSSDLTKVAPEDSDLVLLAAARLGKTRLIDNIYFSK